MFKKFLGFISIAITLFSFSPIYAEQLTPEEAYSAGVGYQLSNNMADAIHWLTIAADQGHVEAQYSLADLYFRGEDVQQDYAEALKRYVQAAEQGHSSAQQGAGILYAQGLGVEQDDAQAIQWFTRAANQGNAHAQFNMGLVFDKGQGVAVDHGQAFSWFKQAAEQGISQAQFNVGMMYVKGEGTGQSTVEAYRWISKAADQGLPIAMAARTDLGMILTPAELSLAQSEDSAVLSSNVHTKIYVHEELGIQIEIPDGWEYETSGTVIEKAYDTARDITSKALGVPKDVVTEIAKAGSEKSILIRMHSPGTPLPAVQITTRNLAKVKSPPESVLHHLRAYMYFVSQMTYVDIVEAVEATNVNGTSGAHVTYDTQLVLEGDTYRTRSDIFSFMKNNHTIDITIIYDLDTYYPQQDNADLQTIFQSIQLNQ